MKSRYWLIPIVFSIIMIFSFPINPDIDSSVDSSIVFAETSPVKIIHDDAGEVWQLPNGQNLGKFGGDTPKRVFDDLTNTWKSNIVTDNGNGNFDVKSYMISTKFIGDKIYHYNNTNSQVLEEKLHVMKKVGNDYVDIPLTFVSRTSSDDYYYCSTECKTKDEKNVRDGVYD